MHPINDTARRGFLSWAVLLCVVPLLLAPLAARSSLEIAGEATASKARFTYPSVDMAGGDKPVSAARDPFVPEAASQNGSTTPNGVAGMRVVQGERIVPSVRAVVTGPSPRALIDDGTHVRMVAIGDALAGSRVTAIDRTGVRLQNGMVLMLAEDRL